MSAPRRRCPFLDGVYTINTHGDVIFRKLRAPRFEDMVCVIEGIRNRIILLLQRRGFLDSDFETVDVDIDELAEVAPSLAAAQQASTIMHIGLGERAGYPVRKIGRSMGFVEEEARFAGIRCVRQNGFTVHADRAVKANDRRGLEQLVSYMCRPPVASDRLERRENGDLIYHFKRRFVDGTKAIVLSPLEFIEKLCALIPPPNFHMVRYMGVFASASSWRKKVVLQAAFIPKNTADEELETKPKLWLQLLARIFKLDLSRCQKCGGPMKVISQIKERVVIDRILEHLGKSTDPPDRPRRAHFYQATLFP